ncbi:MAG TPA: nucleotidyltransferase family protein [Thermoanaerobaculia bacterium]|jgi:hypothetical protein
MKNGVSLSASPVQKSLPDLRALLLAVARGESVDIPAGVDWPRLLEAAEQEGMVALLAKAAKGPAEDLRPLRVRAALVGSRAAMMLDELARIHAAFAEAGVAMLAYKGPLLSAQLYGRPDLRAFSDLDLIVDPPDATRGEAILRKLGYHDPERVAPRTHRRFNSESLFVHDAKKIVVDFHWRFGNAQFPVNLTFADAWSRHSMVHGVPTLGKADLPLVVTSHAAKHLWHRLEFLAQIAALVKSGMPKPPGLHADLSWLLARDFLGIDGPPVTVPRGYDAVRALVDANLFSQAGRKIDAQGKDLFLLLDSRAAVLRSLAISLFVPTHADWDSSKAPTPIHWLSRPLRLVKKYLRLSRR